MDQSCPLFVYFSPSLLTISTIQIEKAYMVCLGFEPAAAEWRAQTKPLSYGGHPDLHQILPLQNVTDAQG